MNNENMMEMNEVIETGMEIATEAAKNNDLLKKIGTGAGYAVAGALAYEGGKRLIKFIKSKVKKAKDKKKQSETAEEKTENVES